MAGLDLLFKFSVTIKTDNNDGLKDIEALLASDEVIELSYKAVRDRLYFTNKRIIAMDVQGITGMTKSYKSFPYSKISSFEIVTAGFMDADAEFRIWVAGLGAFEIKFAGKLNIREVVQQLSKYCI
jgi:hypothetical protein